MTCLFFEIEFPFFCYTYLEFADFFHNKKNILSLLLGDYKEENMFFFR